MDPRSTPPGLAEALPDRSITVRPPPTIGPLSAFGLFALLFALLAGALWWLGPDLARDWRIDSDTVEARDARIEEARCRSRLMIFTVCDIAFTDQRASDRSRQTLWYFFIDRASQAPIVLVRPKSAPGSDPAAISTNLGLEKFYHRLLALILVVALLVLCIGLSIQMVFQGRATRRALARLSGQRLTPIIVGLEGNITIAHKRRRWTYVWQAGGQTQRAFIELASGNDPLFVTPDGKQALALQGPAGGVPLLLDAKLSSLDLSEVEKDAFFAACRKALGTEPVG
jgi:hypothetical protein